MRPPPKPRAREEDEHDDALALAAIREGGEGTKAAAQPEWPRKISAGRASVEAVSSSSATHSTPAKARDMYNF